MLASGDVAESAPQEALGWGAGLDVGAVTRPLRPRYAAVMRPLRARYAPVTRPDLGLLTATPKRYPSDLGLSPSFQQIRRPNYFLASESFWEPR